MTSTKSSPSAAVPLAALVGVLLLGALVFFAVGLPELQDDAEPAAATSDASSAPVADLPASITAPAELPGGLISVTSPDFPQELLQQAGGIDQLNTTVAAALAGLVDLYGEPSGFALYGSGSGLGGTVTVVPGEAGLYLPQGPSLGRPDLNGTTVTNERVDGAVCATTFPSVDAQGAPVAEGSGPASVDCQVAEDGLVYQFSGGGLSAADAVTALHAFADAQG